MGISDDFGGDFGGGFDSSGDSGGGGGNNINTSAVDQAIADSISSGASNPNAGASTTGNDFSAWANGGGGPSFSKLHGTGKNSLRSIDMVPAPYTKDELKELKSQLHTPAKERPDPVGPPVSGKMQQAFKTMQHLNQALENPQDVVSYPELSKSMQDRNKGIESALKEINTDDKGEKSNRNNISYKEAFQGRKYAGAGIDKETGKAGLVTNTEIGRLTALGSITPLPGAGAAARAIDYAADFPLGSFNVKGFENKEPTTPTPPSPSDSNNSQYPIIKKKTTKGITNSTPNNTTLAIAEPDEGPTRNQLRTARRQITRFA